jgi:hypothetical protein
MMQVKSTVPFIASPWKLGVLLGLATERDISLPKIIKIQLSNFILWIKRER